jgi:hypothetical protein
MPSPPTLLGEEDENEGTIGMGIRRRTRARRRVRAMTMTMGEEKQGDWQGSSARRRGEELNQLEGEGSVVVVFGRSGSYICTHFWPCILVCCLIASFIREIHSLYY